MRLKPRSAFQDLDAEDTMKLMIVLAIVATFGIMFYGIAFDNPNERPCSRYGNRSAAEVPVRCLKEFGLNAPVIVGDPR